MNLEKKSLLKITNVSKNFGDTVAVKNINYEIFSGDFVAILGPSGCGKTTLLKMIGGFIEPSSGSIEIENLDITKMGPEKRPTNMVFQGYGLFPHMTVKQNIAYGLKIQKINKNEINEITNEIINLVKLSDLANRNTEKLSGGQQQRVALARALIMRPKVLLLDEPLAALDLKLRHAMQDELRRIHNQIGGTFVFVTHDQSEALSLADRIAVMNEGEIIQEGDGEEIYLKPKSFFVSNFIGETNTLPRSFVESTIDEDNSKIIVRPEAIKISKDSINTDIVFEGVINEIYFLGSNIKYEVSIKDNHTLNISKTSDDFDMNIKKLSKVKVGWNLSNQISIQ
jgi:ABC-type Fe3+/spermidine/putrescine transport system ATPase subunit